MPRTEKPGGLESIGSQRVGHDGTYTHTPGTSKKARKGGLRYELNGLYFIIMSVRVLQKKLGIDMTNAVILKINPTFCAGQTGGGKKNTAREIH